MSAPICTCGAEIPLQDAEIDYAGFPTVEIRTTCSCGRFHSAFVEPHDWSSQEDQGVPFKP